MVVLKANKVIVDESALTGEVHPIVKTPLDPANSELTYDLKTNKSSTLSAGTTISECGDGPRTEGDLAIVTKTGSFTAKGELLSNVLSYQRHKFKFDDEVKIVLAILVVEGIVLVTLTMLIIEDDWVYSWFYSMFVIATVLPPLLPTVFVVSVGISCHRLLGKNITCMNAQGILVAGKVKKAFFDKTGTLTKQGMAFLPGDATGTDSSLMRGIAACQTLHLSNDGSLIGPTVDRIGFEASSATMLDENTISFEGENIDYLKRFDFDHHRMTQSVIVKRGEEAIVYVKGSPEAISKMCAPTSLPSDLFQKARQSARDGIYQIVIATKTYTSDKGMQEVTRDDIEKDLEFLGFINFQNPLKEESPSVIDELRRGNVDCVMITVRKRSLIPGICILSLPLTHIVIPFVLFTVQGDNVLTGE
jgi:magnesium-transporting ATPase (P-type)